MEDDEYYRMMMEDLETLERVHHHQESRPTQQHRKLSSAEDHSPWISGLRMAFHGVARTSIDVVRTKAASVKRRMSFASDSGSVGSY